MYKTTKSRHIGFVLIEALIALMLISVGLVAVSKLQVLSLSGAGEAKSRSEAAVLSQKKLEQLRNILLRGSFTGAPLASNTATVVGTNATYAMTWTVSTPSATLEQRLLSLTTTWTDARNVAQRLDLNSLIAWDDPGSQVKLNLPPGGALIAPTGSAQRGSGIVVSTTGSTQNTDRSRILVDANGRTSLLSSAGNELLVLPAKNGQAQLFTTITGRIYFDLSVTTPRPNEVQVRLSSEGECIYADSQVQNKSSLTTASAGSTTYGYFTYTCYVGPGWYGNVGILFDDTVSGNAANSTLCIGDPAFNGGVSDSTLISAHPVESATRSYRGFKGTSGAYLSTGVAGGRKYGLSVAGGVSNQAAPFDGRPLPSAYPSYYPTVTVGGSTDYFNQDFLITRITGSGSCYAKMTGGLFTRNAGQYVCVNPDNDPASDVCPPVWPGFTVGSGGSINYTLTVALAGTGTGTVTSSPAGISCGATCSGSFASGSSVTLTAAANSGSTFASWTNCPSVSGNTCTVSLTGTSTVTATFSTTPNYTLTAAKSGTGTGTITSADTFINCGSACSASYPSGTTVTLTAAATNGSTFSSWTGCTSVSGSTCTATVSAAATVTASFAAAPATYVLTVNRVNSLYGSVTSADSLINCGTTCSASYVAGANTVLTATTSGGGSFTGWTGCTSTSGNVCTVVTPASASSVTATFAAPTSYALTVTKAGTGSGTVTSSPAGISNCGSTCSANFGTGSTVTLTATAASGSTFSAWSGCTSVSGSTCTVTMSAAKSVTATFNPNALCAGATPISGTAHDKFGTVTISGNTTGTCAMAGGSSANYSCSGINAPTGTVLTLTNAKTSGSGQYSYTLTVTNNCAAQTNVNFP